VASAILIAGSGKIARDVGTYFLKQGNAVSWVSRSESCIIELQAHVNAAVRAFMVQARGAVRMMSASFFLYEELEDEAYDVIIECTREALDEKKDVMARLADRITLSTILATTSQTIPPPQIHPACTGFRMGFPLERAKSVELVFPGAMTSLQKEIRRAFCMENGLRCAPDEETISLC
jgi:3-hydroxyacyl-CoA dehydrogenase